ncbi:uncharacterized protein LACBIDRAFT_332548 [Laccaria bicolor S238N-H82]|uniref:Predicted protein n=1 Tax=Laccaria bicolor (strain S238N-H82 / ATCC MYA-4686) TaxID=486041 RepID=B0DT37_LACBS|nr:uncharacterized protein LACBIDRAFT_332548 [Laccaria bicolor S238N-H82]EDR02207.1 predicted protein [Laccaria bicolor S238N-H82]|eukprot:XP_001887152.1 predicted protein [Laccaria bicolor S238N-H82]
MGKAAHPNHKDHCVVYYYRNQEALQRKAWERAQRLREYRRQNETPEEADARKARHRAAAAKYRGTHQAQINFRVWQRDPKNAEKLRVSAKELAPILAAMDGASESLESGNSADTRPHPQLITCFNVSRRSVNLGIHSGLGVLVDDSLMSFKMTVLLPHDQFCFSKLLIDSIQLEEGFMYLFGSSPLTSPEHSLPPSSASSPLSTPPTSPLSSPRLLAFPIMTNDDNVPLQSLPSQSMAPVQLGPPNRPTHAKRQGHADRTVLYSAPPIPAGIHRNPQESTGFHRNGTGFHRNGTGIHRNSTGIGLDRLILIT